ncbi:hypothetical protein ACTXT7_004113 [Hymenolepis weldensis]
MKGKLLGSHANVRERSERRQEFLPNFMWKCGAVVLRLTHSSVKSEVSDSLPIGALIDRSGQPHWLILAINNSNRPNGAIPLAVQQALLCQPILKEENPAPKRPTVSISKDLTRFIPRSVIQAQRPPPSKKRKLQ